MVSNKGFALLIGVDDYAQYDPAMSLKGSGEDVLKLYWMCRRLLGLAPENIRVLASPPLTAERFFPIEPPPPDMMGPATNESIQAGLAWLAGKMASDAAAPGLLTYSGHGTYSKGRGSLLCPSDMGRDLAKAIAVRDLSKSEALQKVRERLTVVLDCCHVVGDPPSDLRVSTALAHDATADEVAADHADFDVSDRVILAARPGQSAYQALLGKVFHGALTFALVTVVEQWKASQDPNSPGMHVSYKQLLKRVRRMLWSLRMKQNVKLRVPFEPASKRKAIRRLPFFGTHAALTTRRPDAPRQRIQLDPDFYTIQDADRNVLAYIFATNSSGASGLTITYTDSNGQTATQTLSGASTEYWYVNYSFTLSDSTSLSITTADWPAGSSYTVSFDKTQVFNSAETAASGSRSWQSPAPGLPTGAYVFKGTPNAPSDETAYLTFTVVSGSTPPLQEVIWYVTGSAAPTSTEAGGGLQPQNSSAYYTQPDGWTVPGSNIWGASSL